jgi:DNA-binding response OmpR family regulator
VKKKKILIIEDDADARLALNLRLKANGYDISLAMDGVSAISEARKSQPDLVILDLGLPAGDGYTVMERFRNNPELSGTPLIVVSGRDLKVHRERAILAGAKSFLQKPVDNSVLLRVIHRLLGDQTPSYVD